MHQTPAPMADSFERELERLRSRLNSIKSEHPPEQQASQFDSSLVALRTHLQGLRAEIDGHRAALDSFHGDDEADDET